MSSINFCQRLVRICLNLIRISIASGVLFKIFEVENLVSEVGCDQHINVEIDVTQNASVKTRRLIYVAVKVFNLPFGSLNRKTLYQRSSQ